MKNIDNKTVEIDELLDSEPIKFSPTETYGLLIPGDEILKRTCYQWFSVMPVDEILKTNMVVAKYLMASLSDNEVRDDKKKVSSSHEQTVMTI